MTNILNFALKIKGGGREGSTCEVLRPCHPPKIWNVHQVRFPMCTRATTPEQKRRAIIMPGLRSSFALATEHTSLRITPNTWRQTRLPRDPLYAGP